MYEYIEFFGEPETDYSAYTLLEIEGDSPDYGMIDEVLPVGTTDVNGFYLVNVSANTFENGTLTLLLVKNFTGAFGEDIDTNNDGVMDDNPWEAIVDAVGCE